MSWYEPATSGNAKKIDIYEISVIPRNEKWHQSIIMQFTWKISLCCILSTCLPDILCPSLLYQKEIIKLIFLSKLKYLIILDALHCLQWICRYLAYVNRTHDRRSSMAWGKIKTLWAVWAILTEKPLFEGENGKLFVSYVTYIDVNFITKWKCLQKGWLDVLLLIVQVTFDIF
jgi:hypothetical protein